MALAPNIPIWLLREWKALLILVRPDPIFLLLLRPKQTTVSGRLSKTLSLIFSEQHWQAMMLVRIGKRSRKDLLLSWSSTLIRETPRQPRTSQLMHLWHPTNSSYFVITVALRKTKTAPRMRSLDRSLVIIAILSWTIQGRSPMYILIATLRI